MILCWRSYCFLELWLFTLDSWTWSWGSTTCGQLRYVCLWMSQTCNCSYKHQAFHLFYYCSRWSFCQGTTSLIKCHTDSPYLVRISVIWVKISCKMSKKKRPICHWNDTYVSACFIGCNEIFWPKCWHTCLISFWVLDFVKVWMNESLIPSLLFSISIFTTIFSNVLSNQAKHKNRHKYQRNS